VTFRGQEGEAERKILPVAQDPLETNLEKVREIIGEEAVITCVERTHYLEGWKTGLTLSYTLSHISSLFCSGCFGDGVWKSFCPGWP
jgi:hypothetical protein